MMKRLLVFLLPLAVGCTTRQTTPEALPVRVGTLVAEPSRSAAQLNYVGVVEEESSAALSFTLGGTIARIYADEGRQVRQGDPLAELDPVSAQQSCDAARATLAQARDAVARLRKLYEEKSLPEIQWVEAQTKLRQAESAAAIAEKNLEDCTIRAPFDGVVGRRSATAGETAIPGVPVLTLLRISSVKVRFAVPEQEIGSLRPTDRMTVEVAAIDDRRFTATAMEKGAAANAAAHTYDVRATIANPASELLPGMVCRVGILPADAREEIAVPVRAVQQAGDGTRYVWLVRGDSVVRTAVATGRLVDDRIVLTAGIAAGDRIVTDGMQKIGEGSKVVWQ